MNILIIDDDTELCDLLTQYLEQEGFTVFAIHNALDGLNAALSGDHAFLILDVMLPGLNGFDLLRQLRHFSSIPVIMLTARGDEVDRIVGLEMGADDYLPKPFNPRELVARIRAIQRRGEHTGTHSPMPGKIIADDIAIDVGTRTVYQQDSEVTLTAVEFSLLHALIKRIGQVVHREDLAQEALGRKLELFDRSIDVHISSLRKKLGHHIHGVERIKTIRSVGYMYTCTSEGS
jgi:two-component system response regulator CpxR